MFESLPPDTDGDPEDRGSPATGAKRARSNPPALSPEQAPAAAACCLARRAQESRVCSPESCTSAWRSCMRFSNRTLARDGCAVARSNPPARRLLASVAMPAADAAPCALRRRAGAAARTSCDDENLPARDGCAPARSNRRHCRLLASVAMLLMPRRWRAAGTAAPRVAAPRAARLGLQLLGRRGFCYGYDDVIVASFSTGCWDQTRKWSGPSCMRERVGALAVGGGAFVCAPDDARLLQCV